MLRKTEGVKQKKKRGIDQDGQGGGKREKGKEDDLQKNRDEGQRLLCTEAVGCRKLLDPLAKDCPRCYGPTNRISLLFEFIIRTVWVIQDLISATQDCSFVWNQ